MRYQDALREAKFKKLKKFVLVGPEPYLKESFINSLKLIYSEAEVMVFVPDQPKDLVSTLYSGSVFGERLIIIRGIEKIITDKFCEALSSSKDIVVMTVSDFVEAKAKILTKVIAVSEKVECNRMRVYGNDYPLWIMSKASDAGYRLEGDSDKLIYERTGPSMFVISNELKKLYLYKGDARIIKEDDVRGVVSKTSSNSTYDILDELLRRNIPGALRCYRSFSESHEGILDLVYFLAHYIEKLYRLLLLKEDGMDVESSAEVVGLPKFLVKIKYLPRALSYGRHSLAKCLDWVQELDSEIRKFKSDRDVLIERFILRFNE